MAASLPSSEDSGVHRAASAFSEAMRRLDRAAEPPIFVTGAGVHAFPAEYTDLADAPLTEKSEALRQIAALGNGQGMLNQPPQVVMNVSDQDVAAIRRKKDLYELSQFRKWVLTTLDPWQHPERLQWMQQMTPEIFKEMERALEDEAAIKMKYKMIQLRGPHSEEDLWFMYRVSNDENLRRRITTGVLGTEGLPSNAGEAQGPVLYSRGKWARRMATDLNVAGRLGAPRAVGAMPLTGAGVDGGASAIRRMFHA